MSSRRNSEETVNTDSTDADLSQPEIIQPSENYDQDGNYNTVSNSLAAKPEILLSILNDYLQQASLDAAKLENGEILEPNVAERFSEAEKKYQATLNETANQLFDLFKTLPIDRKLDLLIQAKEIGEINDRARAHAKEQMQITESKAIATHQAEVAHKQAHALEHTPPHQSPAATENPQTAPRPIPTAPPNKSTFQLTFPLLSGSDYNTLRSIQTNKQTPAPQHEHNQNQLIQYKAFASTLNVSFTTIPGVPALSQILKKNEKANKWDFGFTFKGEAKHRTDEQGTHYWVYKPTYVGFGVMSPKSNFQLAPISAMINVGENHDGHFSCAASFLNTKLIHHVNMGAKFSVNDCDSTRSATLGPEISYQPQSNKPVSNATVGYSFSSNVPSIGIPEIITNAYSIEELKVLADHIMPVFGVGPLDEVYNANFKHVERITKFAAESTAELMLKADKLVTRITGPSYPEDMNLHHANNRVQTLLNTPKRIAHAASEQLALPNDQPAPKPKSLYQELSTLHPDQLKVVLKLINENAANSYVQRISEIITAHPVR